jgi:single-stranded-DNA-specific exonuclease
MNISKKPVNRDFIAEWMKKGIHPLLLSILDRRELTGDEDLLYTLAPFLELIPSPFAFPGLITAYRRLENAHSANELITIFGDRDVDGITSVTTLYDYLVNLGFNVNWEVPIGEDQYGLSSDKVTRHASDGTRLIITVDCGITNDEEVALYKEAGIDTIIIDHHEPVETIPDALAIINPMYRYEEDFKTMAAVFVTFLFTIGYSIFKSEIFDNQFHFLYQSGEQVNRVIMKNLQLVDYTENITLEQAQREQQGSLLFTRFPEHGDSFLDSLSGSGVKELNSIAKQSGYGFLSYMKDSRYSSILTLRNYLFREIEGLYQLCKKYLPFAMLGTVADIMPLKGPNRIIVKHGLEYLKSQPHKNLAALCRAMQVSLQSVTARDLAWTICPCLNATGRMGDASKGVEFLLNSIENSDQVAVLIDMNNRRKVEGDEAFNTFMDQHREILAEYNSETALFTSETLNKGITGITASKLSRHLNCTVFVAARSGDHYHGSVRGEADIHFVDFLEKADSILSQYGGHKRAAGFRFHIDRLNDFKQFIKANSNLLLVPDRKESIEIDAEIPVTMLKDNIVPLLQLMEPYGYMFETPVLVTSGISIDEYKTMGKSAQHLRFRFAGINQLYSAVFWKKAEWFTSIHTVDSTYTVVYTIGINRYRGAISLQMNIIEMIQE